MIKNIKSPKKLFILSGLSAVLSACVLSTGSALLPPSINSSALAQNPNNRLVPLRDGLVLNYDRAKGKCTVVKGNEVIQDNPCRTTWTAIASGGRRVLFYDRTAREIEIYRLNSNNTPGDGIRPIFKINFIRK